MQDRIAYKDDSPLPRPDPEEVGDSCHFTVTQLTSLLDQFLTSAPSGQISARGFIDIMSDLDSLTVNSDSNSLVERKLITAPYHLSHNEYLQRSSNMFSFRIQERKVKSLIMLKNYQNRSKI